MSSSKNKNPLFALAKKSKENEPTISDQEFLEATKGKEKIETLEPYEESEEVVVTGSEKINPKRDLEFFRAKADENVVGSEPKTIYVRTNIHKSLKEISSITGTSMIDLADNVFLAFIEDYGKQIKKINKKRGLL